MCAANDDNFEDIRKSVEQNSKLWWWPLTSTAKKEDDKIVKFWVCMVKHLSRTIKHFFTNTRTSTNRYTRYQQTGQVQSIIVYQKGICLKVKDVRLIRDANCVSYDRLVQFKIYIPYIPTHSAAKSKASLETKINIGIYSLESLEHDSK